MSLFQSLKSKVQAQPKKVGLAAGNSHFTRIAGENKKNIHLRIDPDGSGTLLVNASRVYHFNPTAAFMVFHLLNGKNAPAIEKEITRSFHITKKQAADDLHAFMEKIQPIIDPGIDACPICDLDLDIIEPFSKPPTAPYRMDLALTYRCNNDCRHCYNDPDRKSVELSTAEWKQVLDKLWQLGIPHVVFTGGEPTLRDDLPELVSYAEKLGMVTGINTNGRCLNELSYVQTLVDAGLDHVQITLESHDKVIHDKIVDHPGAWEQTTAGIQNAVRSKLFVMTNTTLLKNNSLELKKTLQYLSDLKVPTIGLNGLIYSGRGASVMAGIQEQDLPDLLSLATFFTQTHGQRLIWYTPTQYCHFDPVSSGLGVKGCTAALYNMCIEPDGSVLPCQSYYHSLGNFLTEPWENIWDHPLARSIRAKHYLQDKCHCCNLLSECGGGCPLFIENESEIQSRIIEKA